MSNAHRRIRHVDVLTARTRCTEGIDAQVFHADIDLDFVVDLRIHEYRCERRVPARVGIERGNAHQPVDTDFRLQQAVSVFTVYFKRDRLDARAFALLPVHDHSAKTHALSPAQVHAEQHLSPVLAFCAAGARMNGHDRGTDIVLA